MTSRGGDQLTTIPLRKATRDRLKDFGGKGETYDTILNRLMDALTPAPAQRALSGPRRLADFEVIEGEDSES
ncbi:MAG TPA: hypothetical protein VGR28_06760 [Candidatus Thermoplasmatota archaeon]|jgi:hypothetical protein|nr:hypothetical protein [Candidatus Thermoplasmatota archaeon]